MIPESLVLTVPCPPSDRCDTTGVPVTPSRRSVPSINRFNHVLDRVVDDPTISHVSGSDMFYTHQVVAVRGLVSLEQEA